MKHLSNPVIQLIGASENNLKHINVTIPRGKIVCFVGVSGSGKSTIAFDIIAREGQRQYFESLPSFARRNLVKSNRPNVEKMTGLSASIVISQDHVMGNPRSTVGTLTEAYTYLRLLYSRVGLPSMDSSYYSFNHPYGACKTCKGLGRSVKVNVDKMIDREKSLNEGALKPKEWYVGGRQWSIIRATHYFAMDKKVKDYSDSELERLLYAKPETVEAYSGELVDRFTFQGIAHRIMHRNTKVHRGPTERDMQYFDFVPCLECHGGRLNEKSLAVQLHGKNIGEVCNMPLTTCLEFVRKIDHKHAKVITPRLIAQLESLMSVGLGYLTLNRSTDTLSGGEAQRVKMARQLGCDLVEMIYVLDEPTAGLHPKDVGNVLMNLRRLRDAGNSVLVVEHDETVIRGSDFIIEVGPGGGKEGGTIVSSGTVAKLLSNNQSITGTYLQKSTNTSQKNIYRNAQGYLEVLHAKRNTLKDLTVQIPKGVLVALTGVSGSGKSSFVEEVLAQHSEVVVIDQSSIGKTMRGCIGTYVGAFDRIREYFAYQNHMHPSLFSFNSYGGCSACKGVGFIDMDMNFLGDVKIPCEVCLGTRYKEKVLQYLYKEKTIVDVLKMTASEAFNFFDDAEMKREMQLLIDVGLSYVSMGQTLDTLSGGECQRLKLASHLQQKGEFYILDEPTSGLHVADVEKLMVLLNRLVDGGNTVFVVEHNLSVIRSCDWVIDLGPDGGDEGGYVVAEGTPSEIRNVSASFTGRYI